ncbi:MAG TPA: helix-turn-helix domain-containing protein [Candidatus Bathyarchaeia archaeon]|nr:helix-turn-helix domain-containing protein [Candidatus Bathyarchaeia archaeon]
MRRVITELSAAELAEFMHEPRLNDIELFEALSLLRMTQTEATIVARIKFRDPKIDVESYFNDPTDVVQILEREKDGSYVCFIKGKMQRQFSEVTGIINRGYLSSPYEIRDGRLKLAFLGSTRVIKGFLGNISGAGLHCKVLSLTDARFSSSSPLSKLTRMQQRVILSAFELGYYDLPRRIDSRELAKRLKMAEPTLVVHRRKAERRLLSEILEEGATKPAP